MGGELSPNAIGPWDLLDVSEEPEAGGRRATVHTTGAGAAGVGGREDGSGTGQGWCGAAAQSVLTTVPNMTECVEREKGRTCEGL